MRRSAALVACLGLGLAGCGGTDVVTQDRLTPAAAVRQAVERSGADSYRVRLEVTSDDFAGTGEGAFVPGPAPASRITMNMVDPSSQGANTMEFVTIGNDSWSRFSGGSDPAAGLFGLIDGKWMKSDEGADEDADELDVRKQVQLLAAAVDLREVGPERVAGVETTHYSGTATAESISAATGIDPTTKADLIEEFDGQKEPALLEAWLDGDQRIRRFVQSGVDSNGRYRASVEFRDFGADIDIAAPAAKDVVDLEDAVASKMSPEEQDQMSKRLVESLSAKDRRAFCRSVQEADADESRMAPPAELKKLCARE